MSKAYVETLGRESLRFFGKFLWGGYTYMGLQKKSGGGFPECLCLFHFSNNGFTKVFRGPTECIYGRKHFKKLLLVQIWRKAVIGNFISLSDNILIFLSLFFLFLIQFTYFLFFFRLSLVCFSFPIYYLSIIFFPESCERGSYKQMWNDFSFLSPFDFFPMTHFRPWWPF